MKILLLAPFPPRMDAPHGGGRCVARLLLDLSARHRVGVIYFREHGEDPLDPDMQEQCEVAVEVRRRKGLGSRLRVLQGLLHRGPVWTALLRDDAFRAQVERTIRRWQPDIVQAEFLVMGQYLNAAAECARVLRVHDTGVSMARERLEATRGLRRLQFRADLQAWKRYEPQVCQLADSIVVFTARDSRELAAGSAAGRIQVISPDVGCLPRTLDPVGQAPPEVLFLGNFSHRPNVDAALRLTRSIFPSVRRSVPNTALRVIGPSPPRELLAHCGQGVIVTGRVDSVEPWLDRAALFCAPLREGGGIRMKVVEALAAGKAVVASPRALEGIDAAVGDEVVMAQTDTDFSAAIIRLLGDEQGRRSLALGARRWAERAAAVSRSDAFDALYGKLREARPVTAVVGELAR